MDIDFKEAAQALAGAKPSAARKFVPKFKPRVTKEPVEAAATPSAGSTQPQPALANAQVESLLQSAPSDRKTIAAAPTSPPKQTSNAAPKPVSNGALARSHERTNFLVDQLLASPPSQAIQLRKRKSEAVTTIGSDTATEDEEDRPAPKRRKKATGRKGTVKKLHSSRKRKAVEELAVMEVLPHDPIKKFLQRAKAQEQLRISEKRREKAERLQRLKDDPQLALPEAPPPGSSGGGGIEMELVDGKLVPVQQSLVVQATAEPIYREAAEYENIINNASYSKRRHSSRWTPGETERFYQAVSAFGLEFEFLSTVFPGRSRSELRNKWRRESKMDPEKADTIFTAPKTMTIQDEVLETLKQPLPDAVPLLEGPKEEAGSGDDEMTVSDLSARKRGRLTDETEPEPEPLTTSTDENRSTKRKKTHSRKGSRPQQSMDC